jgi:tetratricopeptide (TPR) repeat protein
MASVTICTSCKTKLKLGDNCVGTKFRCPRCRTSISIPGLSLPPESTSTRTPLSKDDKLQDLLDRWEVARDKGSFLSAEELCRDYPELLEELKVQMRVMQKMDDLLKSRKHTNSSIGDSSNSNSPETATNGMNLVAGLEPVSGYRLMNRLGRGGYGEVWKATGPGGFAVALKFVRLEGKAGEVETHALEVIKDIRHANLLATFGAWQQNGYLIIAMELADCTLLDRFEETKVQNLSGIPDVELLEYLAEASKGIDFLNTPGHSINGEESGGIQHRDIKPQNLLLVGGCVKVADFGLARLLNHTITGHTGSLTPSYAAPEFFDGKTHRHSDQYSLAVTYCLLRVGRLPFEGNAAQVMAGHLYHSPNLTMLPHEERRVVARALAKNPIRRWPSCGTFVAALRDCPRQRSKKRFLRRCMIAGISFLLLVGSLAMAHQLFRNKEEVNNAVSPQQSESTNPGQSGDTQPQPMDVRDLVERGIEFNAKRDYDNAIVDFTEAILRDPMLAEAYGQRGHSYEAKGQYDLAIADCTAALKLDPKLFIAYHIRGLALTYKKHFDTAIKDFTDAIQLNPKSSQVFYDRGNVYVAISDYSDAIKDYTEAIRLDPKFANAYRERSNAYNRQGKKDLSKADLQDAERLEKERPALQPEQETKRDSTKLQAAKDHFERGMASYRAKTYGKAVAEMTEAMRLDPDNSFYIKNRGLVYRASGDLNRAIADFSEAIRIRPDYATALVDRGIAYVAKRDFNQAIADYTKALEISPDDALTYEKRSHAYSGKGDRAHAQADLQEAQRLSGKKK